MSQAVARAMGLVVSAQRPVSSFCAQPTAFISSMSRQTTEAGKPVFSESSVTDSPDTICGASAVIRLMQRESRF